MLGRQRGMTVWKQSNTELQPVVFDQVEHVRISSSDSIVCLIIRRTISTHYSHVETPKGATISSLTRPQAVPLLLLLLLRSLYLMINTFPAVGVSRRQVQNFTKISKSLHVITIFGIAVENAFK